ncbi:MAG: hypothetical protein M1834_003957 [Cirrosporium novae-zelandiae]|nr:MAG: hypothetical protein M1834_003957 [Cirrosporium novae-zelandiae]
MGGSEYPLRMGHAEEDQGHEIPITRTKSKWRWAWYVALGVGSFIVIALGLGAGLGLGLGGGHHNSPSGTAGSSSGQSRAESHASKAVPSWRRSTLEYNLDIATWDFNAAPTTRVYNWTISEIDAAPDGVLRKIIAINGQFPGPLIRVNRGDRVLVNITNNLTESTSVHWHGLYQNGTNWMDGTSGITQCGIPPGRHFQYNFTVESQFGTYWYHSHSGTQYTDGLLGPFIIHAPEEVETQKKYSYEGDQVILLQDWYHDMSSTLLPGYLASGNENTEPVPDSGLIQGTNYFDCSSYDNESAYTCYDNSIRPTFVVEQNKHYRLRLINGGAFTAYQFSIDNHTLSVIEADGTLVEPLTVHRVEFGVAQRYSVILHANQTATNYWIRAQMNTYCFSAKNRILDPDVKALLTYTDTTDFPLASPDWKDAQDVICQDLNYTLLHPSTPEKAPTADLLYVIETSFQIGAYALDRGYINSTSWTVPKTPTLNLAVAGLHSHNSTFSTAGLTPAFDSTTQFVISVPKTQIVDLLITNFDDGSHPFHLHGHDFWVLGSSDLQYFPWESYDELDTTNPMRRDTLTVEAFGWTLIRFRLDNPGMWAFHCHNVWHMEAGLLMQWQVRSDVMEGWVLPDDVLGLCEG